MSARAAHDDLADDALMADTQPDGGPAGGGRDGAGGAREEEEEAVAAPEPVVVEGVQAAAARNAFIWGTSVSFEELQRTLGRFFTEFREPSAGDRPLYPQLLEAAARRQERVINIDCANLKAFDAQAYAHLVNYPSQVIPIMDHVINELASQQQQQADDGMGDTEQPRVQVRPFNLGEAKSMRRLGPEDIDKLVCIRGMIIRASSLVPNMRSAYFRCAVCEHGEEVDVDNRDRVAEPSQCPACSGRGTMSLVHNMCVFADKQIVRLQETPESIPEGETPQTVTLFVFDALVDAVKPGDRVEVTGVFRAEPTRANPLMRTIRSIYRTYVDAIHFRKTERRRMKLGDDGGEDDEGDVVDARKQELEEKLRQLSQEKDLYDRLTRSFAPSIWELDDVKKGLLCQLFGGANKEFTSGQRVRGEINILLCGDPGTSKSQLLSFVHKISPRGVYTSGKGSSAVGLTAYVTRDPETRETVLESGALVLSDRGICCIDEFDKMSDYTRAVLHEVMEQQTVSIAKGGVVCTLNARTAVLASANPIESRYNPKLSVVENIQLPPTLLSRFDLIYLVLDKPEEGSDRRLARHLVSLFWSEQDEQVDLIPLETLTAYISYAKRTVQPHVTDDAKRLLVQGYVDMRRQGSIGGRKTVTATPRQLESLIRISEGLARMHLRADVTRDDVAEAMRLVRGALQQAATDPRTGTIDMDLITTGRSAASRDVVAQVAAAVKHVLAEDQSGRPWQFATLVDVVRGRSDAPISNAEIQDALDHLAREGEIEMGYARSSIRLARLSVTRPGAGAAAGNGNGGHNTPLTIRVLAIDGGAGVRAALPLLVLAELERRAGARTASLFDLIVGTSTGGIAALALSRREAHAAGDIAKELVERGAPLVAALRSGEKAGAEAGAEHEALVAHLVGDAPLKTNSPRVAVATYDDAAKAAVILRSWDAATTNLSAKTAAAATSAAPVVLPAVDVGGRVLRDGSMALGSAALQAWSEARATFPPEQPVLLLSLGCGESRVEQAAAGAGTSDVVRGVVGLVESMVAGSASVVDQALRQLLGHSYVRVDARHDHGAQAPATLEALEAEAKALIDAHAAQLEAVARRLKR
eukprot:m51a1_g5050 DNA replication licensing factor MCM4 (1097) ;mRNA; r:58296-64081